MARLVGRKSSAVKNRCHRIGLGVHLHSKTRPRFFHSYGVIELDAAISLLLAKVRCSPPVRQLSESFLNRVFLICIRHELSGPVSSGPFYDYQCTLSRTERRSLEVRFGICEGSAPPDRAKGFPAWRGRVMQCMYGVLTHQRSKGAEFDAFQWRTILILTRVGLRVEPSTYVPINRSR